MIGKNILIIFEILYVYPTRRNIIYMIHHFFLTLNDSFEMIINRGSVNSPLDRCIMVATLSVKQG